MKRLLPIILIAGIGLLLGGCQADIAEDTGETPQVEAPQAGAHLSVWGTTTERTLSVNKYGVPLRGGGDVIVRGYVLNNGAETIGRARVAVIAYSVHGNILGQGFDYLNNLKPGESQKYSIKFLGADWVRSVSVEVRQVWE